MPPTAAGKPPGRPPPRRPETQPTKPIIEPLVEMKIVRWKRLLLGQHIEKGTTVWDSVVEMSSDQSLADELSSLFSKVVVRTARASIDGFRGANSDLVSKELQIIKGSMMRCGRESALARLPPPACVARAVHEISKELLLSNFPPGTEQQDFAQLLQLIRDNACPTPAQQKRLEDALENDPDIPLGSIESYMWEMSRIPAHSERLDCWLYLSTWEQDLRPVQANMERVSAVLACFRSEALPSLLSLILTVGNYLNGGTNNGQADGFRLDLLKSGGMDSVRDNQSKGDLRRFVVSTYLDKFRARAAVLLKDLRPALKNVKRTLENCDGGGLRVVKKVRMTYEKSCDEALARVEAEVNENKRMLEMVQRSGEDSSGGIPSWMNEELKKVEEQVDCLKQLKKRVADEYQQLLAWLGWPDAKETTESFFLLWDDFLIPKECFEAQGPSKVKSMLKPVFCDETEEIDVYGLGRLWEVEIGGLQTSRARSVSTTPRARSLSHGPCSRGCSDGVAGSARGNGHTRSASLSHGRPADCKDSGDEGAAASLSHGRPADCKDSGDEGAPITPQVLFASPNDTPRRGSLPPLPKPRLPQDGQGRRGRSPPRGRREDKFHQEALACKVSENLIETCVVAAPVLQSLVHEPQTHSDGLGLLGSDTCAFGSSASLNSERPTEAGSSECESVGPADPTPCLSFAPPKRAVRRSIAGKPESKDLFEACVVEHSVAAVPTPALGNVAVSLELGDSPSRPPARAVGESPSRPPARAVRQVPAKLEPSICPMGEM